MNISRLLRIVDKLDDNARTDFVRKIVFHFAGDRRPIYTGVDPDTNIPYQGPSTSAYLAEVLGYALRGRELRLDAFSHACPNFAIHSAIHQLHRGAAMCSHHHDDFTRHCQETLND